MPFGTKPFIFSTVGHAVLFALLAAFAAFQGGCFQSPKEEIIPIEFTVVTEENIPSPSDETSEAPPEPETPPEPAPDPIPPPPEPDLIPPPPEPAPIPDPEPPKPEPKQEPPPSPQPKPQPKPFVKGERVVRKTETPKNFNNRKPVTQKALSAAEINKLLSEGAKPGVKNQIPPNEASRCASLIHDAFFKAMQARGVEASESGNPVLEVSFDTTGRVKGCRIVKSSGDQAHDTRVLKAAQTVGYVKGLTVAYLTDNPKATLVINLK